MALAGSETFISGEMVEDPEFRQKLNELAGWATAVSNLIVDEPLTLQKGIDGSIQIGIEMPRPIPFGWMVRVFQITSSTAYTELDDEGNPQGVEDSNGNPVAWTYQVQEQGGKTDVGYGGKWRTLEGGYSGTGRNFLEDANTGNGRQQNGVDHDGNDYPANWKMQPLQTNSYHPGIVVEIPEVGDRECWLFPFSGEDGTCSTSTPVNQASITYGLAS